MTTTAPRKLQEWASEADSQAGEINREALREVYPAVSLGCFIRKPAGIDYLVKRIRSELD